MADPFSVLAAIGLTMQVISLITDTAANTAIRLDDYRNYTLRIADCKLRLEHCSTRLAAWVHIWHVSHQGSSYPSALKILHGALWGQEGSERILRQFELIRALVTDIGKALGIE